MAKKGGGGGAYCGSPQLGRGAGGRIGNGGVSSVPTSRSQTHGAGIRPGRGQLGNGKMDRTTR